MRILTEANYDRVMAAASDMDGPRKLCIWLLAVTGIRPQELCNVRREDFDETGNVSIRTLKREKSIYRNVQLPGWLFDEIKRICTRNGPLLWTRQGDPAHPRWVGRCVKEVAKRAGVSPLKPYDFRHTKATRLSRVLPITDVAAIMGHASIKTTQTYAHADPARANAEISREPDPRAAQRDAS